MFSTALDLAIQNYEELPLTFAMARAPASGCGFTINAVIDPDTIEHVITHELGHTIGFRHSDYYNRSISCGSGGNEGSAGVGAIHVPGTPTTATVGGSIMNSCFRSTETGEFTSSDKTALNYLY